MNKIILVIVLSCSILSTSQGQLLADDLMDGNDMVVLPFNDLNGFIVLDIKFNGFIPLQFIFDTGAEHTILFDKQYTEILGIPYDQKVKILGSDLTTEAYANICRNIQLGLPNNSIATRDILVLENNNLHFNQINGINIDGIIGGDFFKGLLVQINYKKTRLELYHPDRFVPDRKYSIYDIDITKSKPYITADYVSSSDQKRDSSQLRLLLDTGAAITFLLFTNSDTSIVVPPQNIPGNIGKGLGGDILGLIGKANYIGLGNFGFEEVITYYQNIDSTIISLYEVNRNGIIGNEVLSRFDKVAIDYSYHKLYLKPGKKYDREFEFDKSGLNLIAVGKDLNQYYVSSVLTDSPAYMAGIITGDLIKKIGWWSTKWYTLTSINKKLSGKSGKRIKLKIKRGQETLKKSFILRDLLANELPSK